MSFRYRLIDRAGGVIGIVEDERGTIAEDDVVSLPDGTSATVLEAYEADDDEDEDVVATLVLDEG